MATKSPCGGCTPKPPCCKVCCLKGPPPSSAQKILCLAKMPAKNGLQNPETAKGGKQKIESPDSEGVKKCPVCGKELPEKPSSYKDGKVGKDEDCETPDCDCDKDQKKAKEETCENKSQHSKNDEKKAKEEICDKKSPESKKEEICSKKSPESDKDEKKAKEDDEICKENVPRRCKIFVRPKSRELRGGVHYTHCDCGKLNGLQHDCRRSECQGCPECIVYPPECINSPYTNAKHLTQMAEAMLAKRRCPKKVM